MPMVNGKEYPYTKAGIAAAEKAKKAKGTAGPASPVNMAGMAQALRTAPKAAY